MKKISLNNLNLEAAQQLSRVELKSVLDGGIDFLTKDGDGQYYCECDNHKGSWYSDRNETSSIDCRDSNNNSPGPVTCR